MSSPFNVTFQHAPAAGCAASRRRFLRRLAGGVAAAGVLPALGFATERQKTLRARAAALSPGNAGDEAFWALVKDQFPLRPGLILMNAANLCPSPYSVAETVFAFTRDVDADASFQNRGKFNDLHDQALAALARYMGADADEVVITRNTSEGNNTVIAGLDLKPSDEVVLWDQNHPSNNVAWDVRAQRYGFTVKRVPTPARPQSPDDLLAPFAEALTTNTRVLAFSHVSNVSGVALPAKALCTLARDAAF
jgi:isopenicillin-N epimerase